MLDSGETSEPPEERHPPRRFDRFSQRWRDPELRVVAAVLAVVAAVAIAAPYLPGQVGVITGAGLHAAGKAAASGTAAAQPRPVSTKPIPPTPEQLAASTHVPAKLAAALKTWNSGPGGGALAEITNEVGAALQSGGLKAYVQMKAACGSLESSVNAAGTRPPIPDATMQSKYSAALTVLAKAASDCRSAISLQPSGDEYVRSSANPAVLHLAQSELNSGIKSLAGITTIIIAATGPA